MFTSGISSRQDQVHLAIHESSYVTLYAVLCMVSITIV